MSHPPIHSDPSFGPIPSGPGRETFTHRGWELVRITSESISVVVNPEKGAEILSLQRRHDGLEVLWRSPWGVRTKGAPTGGGDSVALLMEQYPGGWQTVFPNGGDACVEHGVEWGMHGEVWLTPFELVDADATSVSLEARLVRSPFRVHKRIAVDDDEVVLTETIVNEGNDPIGVMWSQHPAFGAPLVGPETMLTIDAAVVLSDEERPATDLAAGATGTWPYVGGRDGTTVDLRTLPASGSSVQRLLYLTEMSAGLAIIANPSCDAAVTLRWDVDVMPVAWYWLEAGGTAGFPWFGAVEVLALEPASTIPAGGIARARNAGRPLTMEPNVPVTAAVSARLTGHLAADRSADRVRGENPEAQ